MDDTRSVVGGLILLLLCLAAWMVPMLLRRARRASRRLDPFPSAWASILSRNVRYYDALSDEARSELHGHISIFLAEKRFEGCGGLAINDEIRVTIAGQACLLLLRRSIECFDPLKSIIVYPSTYRAVETVHEQREGSVVTEEDVHRLGESWTSGQVVLAWDAVKHGAWNVEDGRNVVLHEFAHQLDQEDGTSDGTPILAPSHTYTGWARVLSKDFLKLRDDAKRGRKTVLDRYGAANEAEFFAVATEAFFEKPEQLKRKHPELFAELATFYQFDPATLLRSKS